MNIRTHVPAILLCSVLAMVSAPAAAVPPGQAYPHARMLASNGSVPWDALSDQEQDVLGKHRRSWSGYSSQEQQKLRRGARRYLELSPGKRKSVKQKHKQYEKMSPKERERLRDEYRRRQQHD